MTTAGAASVPPIASVDANSPRPRWSVMVPTYECARFLGQALASVLEQAPGPQEMQIEVVDDASSDDPRSLVDHLGRGRVDFFRQPSHLGVPENLNACIRRARGEIVHILHGDDAVRPGFYTAMERAFARSPSLGAAYCRHLFMDSRGQWQTISPLEQDASGILEDAAAHLASEQRIMAPSICVRRAVYEHLGGFHASLCCSEDWEMWARIAVHYPVWYETEPLAVYRIHDVSNTGRHERSGADIAYTALAIDLIAERLPPKRRHAIATRARSTYAIAALHRADQALARGDVATARAQFFGAFSLSRSPRVLARAAASIAPLVRRAMDRARRTEPR